MIIFRGSSGQGDSTRAERSRRLTVWCTLVVGPGSAAQLFTNYIAPDRPMLGRYDWLFGLFTTAMLSTNDSGSGRRLSWQRMVNDETARVFRYQSITIGLWATILACTGMALFRPMTGLCAMTIAMDSSGAAGLLTRAWIELRPEAQA